MPYPPGHPKRSVGTGEHAHDWAHQLREAVDGLEVEMPPNLEPFQQQLLGTLGVKIRYARSDAPGARLAQ